MYKIYNVKLENNKEIPLLAKHNREAMKLAGKLPEWYGNIIAVIDECGRSIIDNREGVVALA